jgi:hypothetical protein
VGVTRSYLGLPPYESLISTLEVWLLKGPLVHRSSQSQVFSSQIPGAQTLHSALCLLARHILATALLKMTKLEPS